MKSIILLVLLSGLVYSRILKNEDEKQSSRTGEGIIDDVILTEEQYEFLFGRGARNGASNPVLRWPNKELPYEFESTISNSRRIQIEEVISRFNTEMNGCIQIVPRASALQKDWFVSVYDGKGCWSLLGRVKGKWSGGDIKPGTGQRLSPCWGGTILHEFIHAIGFLHEQARTDRDDYVKIFYENVKSGKSGQFDIATIDTDTFGTPYDGFSIMHYGRKAFSKNTKDTIQSISSDFTSDDIGQRKWMTDNDALKIRKMYECEEANGCGGEFNAESGQLKLPNFPNNYGNNKDCKWVINVPAGSTVTLKFETLFDIEACPNCRCDFVEIRDGGDETSTSLGTFCGPTLPNNVKSTGNKMFVKFHSDVNVGGKGFSASFKKNVSDEDCKDIYTSAGGCPFWANSGYCNKYSFMKKVCKKSCNLC